MASHGDLRSVEVYDPRTDSWTCYGSLLDERAEAAAAAFNRKIYLMGGARDLLGSQVEWDLLVFTPRQP